MELTGTKGTKIPVSVNSKEASAHIPSKLKVGVNI